MARTSGRCPVPARSGGKTCLPVPKPCWNGTKTTPPSSIWSCGNESYGGKTLWEMSEYFRRTDPSRLVHYEGIFWNREYPATSDMESQMYTPVADIKKFLAEHPEKPFIMCEYSHAMGNSCGGITDYTEYAYEEPLYQGGFIWEYMDHGIAVTDPDGKARLCLRRGLWRPPHRPGILRGRSCAA